MKEIIKILLGLTVIISIFVIGFETKKTVFSEVLAPTKAAAPLLPIVAMGVSALGGLLQGTQQRRQARQLERSNIRQPYQQSSQLRVNQALAQQMYQGGLPDQVYNNQLQQIQQSQATGLRFLNQRGALPINVSSVLRTTNQALGNLNAQDAMARQQGAQQLMNVNRQIADDERYGYNVNVLQPYQQNVANVQATRRAGIQNQFGALNLLAQGAMMGVFNNVGGASRVSTTVPMPKLTGFGTGYNPSMTNPFTV